MGNTEGITFFCKIRENHRGAYQSMRLWKLFCSGKLKLAVLPDHTLTVHARTVDIDIIGQCTIGIWFRLAEPVKQEFRVANRKIDTPVTLAITEQVMPVSPVQADSTVKIHHPGHHLQRVSARRTCRPGHRIAVYPLLDGK